MQWWCNRDVIRNDVITYRLHGKDTTIFRLIQDICLTEFRRLLKTVLFRWDSAHCDFFVLIAPCISTLTYLLTYLLNNFSKLKRIVIIFAKQHQRSKEELTVERKCIVLLLYLAKWNALLAVTHQHQKGAKFHKKSQKSVSAYCWVVYSSSKSWHKSY